jgi:hypothetical protein
MTLGERASSEILRPLFTGEEDERGHREREAGEGADGIAMRRRR